MTALWAATVLEHFPRLGSQFRQGRRALAHGQLRSEHVDEIEQGQRGCWLKISTVLNPNKKTAIQLF